MKKAALKYSVLTTWKNQTAQEARAFVKKAGCDLARQEAYVAGMMWGWDDAITTLKLHGYIKVNHNA